MAAAPSNPSGPESGLDPHRTFALPEEARRHWRTVLVLGLVGLAIVTAFDTGTRRGVPEVAELLQEIQPPDGRTILERVAYLNWLATGLLLVGAECGTGFVAVSFLLRIARVGRRPELRWLLALSGVALVIVAGVGASQYPGETTLARGLAVFLETHPTPAYVASGLGIWAFLPMRLAVGVAVLSAAAMLALLLPSSPTTLAELKDRNERLKLLLYLTGVLLVAGVLATRGGYRWLFAFLMSGPDDPQWAPVQSLVEAGVFRVGVLYSLYLILFYLPTACLLHRQLVWGEQVLRQATPEPGTAVGTDPGLLVDSQWLEMVKQTVALLAPALTGTLTGLLG